MLQLMMWLYILFYNQSMQVLVSPLRTLICTVWINYMWDTRKKVPYGEHDWIVLPFKHCTAPKQVFSSLVVLMAIVLMLVLLTQHSLKVYCTYKMQYENGSIIGCQTCDYEVSIYSIQLFRLKRYRSERVNRQIISLHTQLISKQPLISYSLLTHNA